MDYRSLKTVIMNMSKAEKGLRKDITGESTEIVSFQRLLESELEKVNLFSMVREEDISRTLSGLSAEFSSSLVINSSPKSFLTDMESRIEEVANEITFLDAFVRLNFEGFLKITRKFDFVFGVAGSCWFSAKVSREPFCNINFENLLILLSLTWERFRNRKQGDTGNRSSKNDVWVPPETFIRSTAKYWVPQERILQLKISILKHIPFLIFGFSSKEQEKMLFSFSASMQEANSQTVNKNIEDPRNSISETQLISSVYFDSCQADSYHDRSMRTEGARLVRFRWYGPNDGRADKEIFIERKVHHESWTQESSAKERFCLPQGEISRFLSGDLDINNFFENLKEKGMIVDFKSLKYNMELAHEVSDLISSKNMQPMMRTCYFRSAFQLPTNNEVRISLDSQMNLVNEEDVDGSNNKKKNWCRSARDVLTSDDIVRFPYAILEVKLQDASNPPVWVSKMLEDCRVIQVHKFSKFIHGMAFLHSDKIKILPHWFSRIEKLENMRNAKNSIIDDFRIQKEREDEESRIERIIEQSVTDEEENEDDTAPKSLFNLDDEDEEGKAPLFIAKGGTLARHHVCDMQSIEPKSIFANERTFLHYTQKGLYLMTLLLAVFRFQKGNVGRTFFEICSCFFLCFYFLWCLTTFYARQLRIESRMAVKKTNERLDTTWGPRIVLGITLFSVLLILVSKNIS